jgi:hypothetical protein
MTDYIFPFEYASLIILVAMIGAAILIREFKQQPEQPQPAEASAEAAESPPPAVSEAPAEEEQP